MHTNTAHSFSLWSWLFFLSYTQHIWNEKKKTIQSVQKRELQKKVTYGKTWRKKQARMKFEYGEWRKSICCSILWRTIFQLFGNFLENLNPWRDMTATNIEISFHQSHFKNFRTLCRKHFIHLTFSISCFRYIRNSNLRLDCV